MKKLLLGFSLLSLLCASVAPVADAAIIKSMSRPQGAAVKAVPAMPSTISNCFYAMYDPTLADIPDGVADYYICFSSGEGAVYDKYNGPLMKDQWMLILDLYAPVSSPVELPEGTYTASDTYDAFTFDDQYTYLRYFDANGNYDMNNDIVVTGPITVAKTSDGYTITAKVNGNTVTFSGKIDFDDATVAASVYPQIKQNLDLNFTGALANYDGNLYQSNTGCMYINLYEKGFNTETGGMTEEGFSLAIMVFGKLFSNSSNATLDPGKYSVARNFNRYTFFPGIETDYMGMTVILGSYAKELNLSGKYSDTNYGYSYISDGTVEIEDKGNGVFRITVDCVTSYGHTVKGVYEGTVPVHDQSDANDKPSSTLSTLEDDVQLDLEQIKMAYVWNNGVVNGCQTFLVDIGSPSGRDGLREGDIMRLELVLPGGTQYIQDGTYTVMEEKYDNYYEPYKLGRGRWVSTSTGGTDMSGTRYFHFEEGRYLIMDHHAPAASGTVGVTKQTTNTLSDGDEKDCYRFDIAVMCDANFHIDGSWTGPATLMYDPEQLAGIESVDADANAISVKWLDADNVLLLGVTSAEGAAVYNMAGQRMECAVSGCTVNISSLAKGVYVLNINGKSIKIVKK
ncbi:MAG: T9SS type A sorting domain-containing protein [Muribaculaceae bacterium]|nr:T9SS type A sorting domain-containing protein [Muribaculaceae bacterium]